MVESIDNRSETFCT